MDSLADTAPTRAALPTPLRAVAEAAQTAWRWLWPHLPGVLGIVVVAIAGGFLGASIAPSTRAEVGPLTAQIRVVPSLHSGVRLLLPPVGEVDFDTHSAPFAVEGRISQVDLDGARQLIDSPAAVEYLGDSAPGVLRGAAIRAALTTVGFAGVGALLLSLVVYRRSWRRHGEVAATVAGMLVLTAGMGAATADPAKLEQPKFTGLLSQAPYIAGSVPNVLERLENYRSGLADIVRSVTALYATTGSLPTLSTSDNADVVTVLHISDIHLNPIAFDLVERLVTQFKVNVVVDTGDITTWGSDVESSTLRRIGKLDVPYVFVRGNHDSVRTQAAVAAEKNAIVLDDKVVTVAGLTIAGIGDPVFTPDEAALEATTAATLPAATARAAPTSASGTANVQASGELSTNGGQAGSQASGQVGGQATQAGTTPAVSNSNNPQYVSHAALAKTIASWDAQHPDQPVEIAAMHEPYYLQPLLGQVPTILAGHTHKRQTTLDHAGTRIMIEGSTGGAGLTARGLDQLAAGSPLPLAASLIYVARRGPQAGQVVATDAITVGGYGLTSVNLQRTVFREPTTLTPSPTPSPTGTESPSPAG
jgi:predicted MPP superfamily phosphohydrolase